MRMKLLRIFIAAMTILIVFGKTTFAQGVLTNVGVIINDNEAGVNTVYTFNFTTDASGIPVDGKIMITFPSGFDLTDVLIAQTVNAATLDGGLSCFAGAGVISVIRDGTGTPVGGNTVVGIYIAMVQNNQTAADNYTVNIATKQNDNTPIATGTSQPFSVSHSSLYSFEFNTISDHTAGENFSVTITAVDLYGNTVEDFASTVSLSDTSGTIFPASTTNFNSGIWSGNVQIIRSGTNNEIMASEQNKYGVSNKFNIGHGLLNHFDFDSVSNPQTAGNSFNIRIVAYDQYNNIVTSFTDTVALTDLSGSLSAQADNFVAGILNNQSVIINKKQKENYITATDPLTSKSGQSNLFNVEAGSLTKFYISPITSPQKAGQFFPITIIAQDNNGNTVSSFENKVTITDKSGNINPSESGTFVGGQWMSTVKVGLPQVNNEITVTKFAGSETGTSNAFDVVEGDLDNFEIETISTPQVAGSQFPITIKAKDIEGNTVTSFNGQVSISDVTGSIVPGNTSSFSNGEWTGDVTITSSQENNRIFVTGNGNDGKSNVFDVNPADLDHFAISNVTSPKTAGQNFTIAIEARDAHENIVTGFSNQVKLTDETGTILPSLTSSFISGSWSGNVNITQKSENNKITVNDLSSGKKGESNYFYVLPAAVNHIVIRDNPAGLGSEVGARTFNIGEKKTLYAAGYDQWNNYVRDIVADWDTTGNIDLPSPLQGASTVFSPTTPYTSGRIYADSVSVAADSTGIFTVGTIHHLLIRDAPAGEGTVVNDRQVFADDSLVLYAAAYDEGNSYLGPASVSWSNNGSLQPPVSEAGSKLVFNPSTARVSGQIIASHSTAPTVSTGQITVYPGAPVGTIVLHPQPKVISAHPDSFSIIHSDKIYDSDGNLIDENELFTVTTNLGTITSPDEDAGINGFQIKSDSESKLFFVVNAGTEGGAAQIHVNSVGKGSAVGDTTVIIANLKIVSVNTDFDRLTRGQTNVPIRMVVNNVSSENINIINAGLKFSGPAPDNNNLTGEYSVTRTDGLTQLLANTQSTLTFVSDLVSDATTGLVTIDGFVTGELSGLSVIDTSAGLADEVLIQSPPILSIEKIEAFADTVIQGTNTTVAATIRNAGEASAIIDSDSLTFWAVNFGINETNKYGQTPHLSNPDTLIGKSSAIFNYTVKVGTNALIDTISLDGKINGHDINSDEIVSDIGSDELDGWWVKQASEIEITQFNTSQLTVTDGQEEDWYVSMVVNNSGGADLRLDSVIVEFSVGGMDISNEYTIIYPYSFIASGSDTLRAGMTDTLRVTVDKTGITLGTITITGKVYLGDMISGQIVKKSVTGITVQSPAQLAIDYIHTSQSQVTVGQSFPWQIIVSMTNNGGGDIALDSTQVNNFIVFDESNESFDIAAPPGFYGSNIFILKSGQTDSLFFTVDTTGEATGNRKMTVNILAHEMNSHRHIFSKDSAQILIELPAEIKIKKTENLAPNSPYVDTEQNFQISVIVENTGEDGATNIDVSLSGDSSSTIINPTGSIALLQGRESDTLKFNIRASSSTIFDEIFSSTINAATAENTPESDKMIIAAPMDSFAVATVQQPAEMKIISVTSSDDTVKAFTTKKWYLSVVVKNDGEGELVLEQPKESDITIFISDTLQKGYLINAPTGFQNSPDLILAAGEDDVLIYEIYRTGFKGGRATVKVSLAGSYPNTTQHFLVSDLTEVYIKPSADVFVDNTETNCFNVEDGVGQVNSGQTFSILVKLINSGAEEVDDVVVSLTAAGYSIAPQMIEKIPPSGNSIASFNITAKSVADRLTFLAKIISATARESGLPATIGTATDSTADIRIHEPANLRIDLDTEDTIFTAGQNSTFKLHVINLGTAEVDESGQLAVLAPAGYFIDKGDHLVQKDTANFIIDQQLNWQILPPVNQSENDTITVVLFNPPLDKNVNLPAGVQNPFERLIVRTVPSSIEIQTFKIISPQGATDDTISTRQNFSVELGINPSDNLDSLRATVKIPTNFGYGIQEDSLKFLPFNHGTWNLRAPEAADTEPAWIKVTVYGKTNGKTETVKDSFAVVVKKRAEIAIDRIWTSSLTDSILSSGKEFDLNVLVKSKDANQAKVKGNAFLRVNFGATDITTDDPWIKNFNVDSAVSWRVKAPDFAKGKSPLTVYMESIPYDENTNLPAVISDGETIKQFYVETVIFGNITIDNFRITSPYGATDRILSSYQSFDVEAFVQWQNSSDIPLAALQLPAGFTTLESNPKKPSDSGQQGIVAWTIYAPPTAISNQNIWIQLSAKDANSGSPFALNSDSIEVDVISRPEIMLNAQIVSPASALDGEISAGDFFIVSAHLEKTGDANLVGNYSAELTLPEGQNYTPLESLIKSAHYDQTIGWTIQAPMSERNSTNMKIELISTPQDENTNLVIPAEAISNKDVEIPISTEEKSVIISKIADNGKNTIARGDTSVTVLGLKFIVSGDEYSNNVLFSGVKVKLKDRLGNVVENPQHAISKVTVVNHENNAMVYGQVTEIPQNNPIAILFSLVDTLKPENPNLVDFKVDVSSSASITDFQLTIDSSNALQLLDEGSGRVPNIKNEAGVTIDELNIFSSPSVIIQADFKKSFFNYPNPFGDTDKPVTYFVYFLEQASDVNIQIYTIIGERVWTRSFSKNDPQGKQGRHEKDIYWDAKNDQGHKVLNGVYVARISTGSNKDAIIKIAVIK